MKDEDCMRVSITDSTTSLSSGVTPGFKVLQPGLKLPKPYLTISLSDLARRRWSSGTFVLAGWAAFLIIWSMARYPHHPPPGYSSSMGLLRYETLHILALLEKSTNCSWFLHLFNKSRLDSRRLPPKLRVIFRSPILTDTWGHAVSLGTVLGLSIRFNSLLKFLMFSLSRQITAKETSMSL